MSDPRKDEQPEPDSSEPGEPVEESTSRKTSTRSEKRSKRSKKHWPRPANVREFASQANTVATMVLNGEIDIDQARAYASLARVISQTISSEVTRSRFLKEVPDLEFEEYE